MTKLEKWRIKQKKVIRENIEKEVYSSRENFIDDLVSYAMRPPSPIDIVELVSDWETGRGPDETLREYLGALERWIYWPAFEEFYEHPTKVARQDISEEDESQ